MRRLRSALLAALAAVAAVALSACAGLPTSGTVHPGLQAGATSSQSESFFIPDRPQPGATPEQIVEGFIRAGAGPGANGQWDRAREFLAPSLRSQWKPEAQVTIDLPGDRVAVAPEDGRVDLALIAVATVDERGTYQRTEIGARSLPFRLAQQADGEWRITEAPDGVVLSRDFFPSVFHRYSVMYFDQTWEYLVPDVRWFPTSNAASRITDALVNKAPSDWLAASIYNAFPDSVSALPAVPVSAGSAQVELSDTALAVEPAVLDRMLTQLEASLASAGVTDVEMEVGAAPLTASPVETRSTRVPAVPLVLTADGFGFLTGDAIDPIPGLSPAVEAAQPVAVQIAPDRDLAALRLADDSVVRVGANGSYETLDQRGSLVDPSIDPFGTVWSVPEDRPAEVVAFLEDGRRLDVADAWPGATGIAAMAVSRDGTRIAAVIGSGGRTALWVAGIERDPDSVPVRLGDPVQLALIAGTGVGIAWLDDLTVGVLSHEGEASAILEQVVGGPASTTAAAASMVQIAGGTSLSTVRLRAADGILYVKRATNWEQTAADVLVLATQQGTPR
ncbi:LpqB family beta-propeller domain-containing protein [Microbacterium sp. 2FI]|uniref:LpqB family beta-propeller domain-containing protein n=1 Tax=Microbacterium sp. 2FI TaxID=2502193 RepID=UPI0010FA2D09|nr:LpqB family beta-propeller domain-containing protein [Microbacterium sp. 2FI]